MSHTTDMSADEALQRLIDGNARFLQGEARRAGVPRETLSELALGQHPFATILGCSDSRVPPEWIFDAGPGELFVVRVAGNVLSPEVAGSLQYAGRHLKTPLMVVLGHEGCGAIQAALQVKHGRVQQLSRIQILVDDILPALAGLDPDLPPAAQLAKAVERNVRWTVRTIIESPEGQARAVEGRVRCASAPSTKLKPAGCASWNPWWDVGQEPSGRPLRTGEGFVTAARNDSPIAVRCDFAKRVSPMALVLMLSASSVAGQTPYNLP